MQSVIAGRRATSDQRDVSFRHEILGVDGDRVFVRWWSTFVRRSTRRQVELDGIFVLDFGRGEVLCLRLQEWWPARDRPQ